MKPFFEKIIHNEKTIQGFGRLATATARKIKFEAQVQKSSWAKAIKSSFEVKDSLACSVCQIAMVAKFIDSYLASNKEK
ncbi:hypothetical protein P3G55_05640 [Leptospira sp. 96542]|nr:hypothetical protein [Leptospira sp. 96542]